MSGHVDGPRRLARRAASVGRFAGELYLDKARRAYAAHVRGDLPARLAGREGRFDPYPVYERIRAAGRFVPNRFGNLATADHAACDQILRSRRFGTHEGPPYDPDRPGDADGSLLGLDPPDHTRLRRIVAPAFGPRALAAYRPMVQARVDRLLDAVAHADSFDFVTAIGAPLPISVITALLDIPGDRAEEFERYGEAIGSALSGIRGLRHAAELDRADRALRPLFADLIERRRREPGEDVISRLVAAGDDVRPAELFPMCELLLVAGFETTVNALGNAVLAFARFPDQWRRLVADPGLAASATEEILRYDSSVQRTDRISRENTEIAGQPIRAGQRVQILIGGANRDPGVFADPARFDITRENAADHLAFSSGVHYCLGQPLARMEIAVTVETLARRMPRLRPVGQVRYRRSTLLRGPKHLPVCGT